MPGINLKQVRREITIQQVLDLLGFVPTARQGSRLRGPCPIHGDGRPQSRVFSVHLGCHRYRCFRCHSAGTQLDLWAAVHHLSIYAAAGDLCNRLGIAIPRLPTARIDQHPGS
jgi:DNA primase